MRIRSAASLRIAARAGERGAASTRLRPLSSAASKPGGSHGTRCAGVTPPNRSSVERTCPAGSSPIAPDRTLLTTTVTRSGALCSSTSAWPRRNRASPTGSAAPTATTRSARRSTSRVAALRRGAATSLSSSSSCSRFAATSTIVTSTQPRTASRTPAMRSAVSSGQRAGRPMPVSTRNPPRCVAATLSSFAGVSAPVPARRQAAAKPGASSSRPSDGATAAPWVSASARATATPSAASSPARATARLVRPGDPPGPQTAMTRPRSTVARSTEDRAGRRDVVSDPVTSEPTSGAAGDGARGATIGIGGSATGAATADPSAPPGGSSVQVAGPGTGSTTPNPAAKRRSRGVSPTTTSRTPCASHAATSRALRCGADAAAITTSGFATAMRGARASASGMSATTRWP